MAHYELTLTGMTCDGCSRQVGGALAQAGARPVEVDWRSGRARIDAEDLDEAALEQALAGTRYGVAAITEVSEPAGDRADAHGYDLIVLGSGGAAFAAAIRARDLGKRVVMIEHETTGGTCVNVGCIPSKALLVRSERARREGSPTLATALAAKRALVESLRQAKYVDLLDEYGIDFRRARGRISGPHTVDAGAERIRAGAILIATGARPAIPDIAGLEDTGYLTSTTALELAEAPARLAVIGAGPVGLELGQMLGNFGSHVTFLARRGIMPEAEPEVSAQLQAVLTEEGHRLLAPAAVTEVRPERGEKVLRGSAGGKPFELRVDEILVATGRRANSGDLGLDAAGVARDSAGAIDVDEEQRTSVGAIYAAGDVTTQPRFVYVAAAGGAAAVENALGGGGARLDFDSLPQIVFTTPPIAQAGLTESQARALGIDVDTRVLALEAVPRALVNDDTRGAFKLVAERGSGRLVGASAIARGAPDAIHAAVIAIERGMTVSELAEGWAPYLTMAEALKLAAQTFDRDVARLSCCAA